MLPQWQDYEPFSLFAATRLYLRLTNPKQFLPEGDPKKLKKIKSILNFVKTLMYPMIVDYQQQTYSQRFAIGDNEDLDNCTLMLQDEAVKQVSAQNNKALSVEFEYYLKKICTTIKWFLKTTPYVNDPVVMHNLYQSCLMTLINQVTLCNANKARLENKVKKGYKTEDFINKVYIMEQTDSVVVFHLPESMHNYIDTLVKRIRRLITKDLVELVGSHEPTEEIIKAVLQQSTLGGSQNDHD